jgi:NADPH:quinone reductase-like Zn-dependent oxidoreductase
MKALTYSNYGPIENLTWTTQSSPPPGRGQMRVAVRRAALNPKDALVRKGRYAFLSGRRFPKRSGLDFTGVVLDSRSPAFSTGDRVYGMLGEWRFLRGTLAEEVLVSEDEAAVVPGGVSDDDVAGLGLTGSTALQALRDLGRVRPGSRVWIHGASGGVGTVAIQIARLLGGTVTTTSSAANRALCEELGATSAFDYREELGASLGELDVVFDVFGNLSRASVMPHFAGRGVLISTVPSGQRIAREVVSRISRIQERLVVVKPRRAELGTLAAWVGEGKLRVVVDSRFPPTGVHEAFRVLESKRARGKIIVEMA